jgi:hypothetical protein|nr:hypothetical protein [Kofleriaceae bacterium]
MKIQVDFTVAETGPLVTGLLISVMRLHYLHLQSAGGATASGPPLPMSTELELAKLAVDAVLGGFPSGVRTKLANQRDELAAFVCGAQAGLDD